MISLPAMQRKHFVLLFQSFRVRQAMNITDAAQEAASITGFNEKTMRSYRTDFYENGACLRRADKASIRDTASLIGCCHVQYVREHAYQKGAAI